MTPDPAADDLACGDRHLFRVEGIDAGDALLRVLGLVAVQQARVTALDFDCADRRFQVKLEVQGLGPRRAEHLRHRLAQLPIVEDVTVMLGGR